MRKLVVLLLLSSLASCQAAPPLLLLLDPYYAQLLTAEGTGEGSLERSLRGTFRVRTEVLDPQANAAEEAERVVGAQHPRWVFLSPLLPFDGEALAARFPEVRFLGERAAAPVASPVPNLTRLSFQRERAFRDAGTVVARLLRRPSLEPLVGASAAGRQPKAGLLLAAPTPEAEREAQAFREAFAAEAGPGLLVERRLASLADTAQARRALQEMREEGAVVFMLKTYGLTGFCLETLRSEGGLAVLEEGAGAQAFTGQVLLWFEEDLAGALRSLPAAGKAAELEGRVRLVAGPLLRSAPARAELGFPELFE
jgi:hypothetical protein